MLLKLMRNFREFSILMKLVQTGFRKSVTCLTLDDAPSVSNALVEYHCMIKVKAAMDQFKNGLNALGLWGMLQECPAI